MQINKLLAQSCYFNAMPPVSPLLYSKLGSLLLTIPTDVVMITAVLQMFTIVRTSVMQLFCILLDMYIQLNL